MTDKPDLMEVNRMASEPNLMKRQDLIVEAIRAAYDQGWKDCDLQWASHVLMEPDAQKAKVGLA